MNLKFIRENSDLVIENEKKRFNDTKYIMSLIKKDKLYTNTLFQLERTRKIKNIISSLINKKIGTIYIEECKYEQILGQDNYDYNSLSQNSLISICKFLKTKENSLNSLVKEYKLECDNLLKLIGNILNDKVEINNDEKYNKEVYNKINYQNVFNKYGHYELCQKLDMVDFDSGIKVFGNRGYFFKHIGQKLNRAILNYAQDFLENKNFSIMSVPHLINNEKIKNICQLSEFEETLYKSEDKYLIATSEQPLTAYFEKKIVSTPCYIGGISPCYRKEAGSHGKDTLGIFRVHQFEKVEQFVVCDKDKSELEFENLINNCKEFYDSLGISYRIVNIVSGALNNSASIKYDLEGFFPNSGTYRELVSCTNTTDYFSKNLEIKNKKMEICHLLNCTLCANTRVICCLLETYQTENGFVVPSILVPYFKTNFIPFVEN